MSNRWFVTIAASLCLIVGTAASVEFHSQVNSSVQAPGPAQADVLIRVSDGERLAADIYLPEGQRPFPVLFSLTPYNKKGQAETARFYTSQGYAVVVADSRGVYASHGDWTPYMNDGRDGYDIQQWIAQQPWANGTIGMFGSSYPGFTQLLPAAYRSSSVKALLPEAAQSDNFGSIWSTNGLYHLALGLSWASRQEAIATERPMPDVNWMKLMWHLPLKTVTEQIGIQSKFVMDTINHYSYDEFWKKMSVRHLYSEMDVPAFHVTGWYDDLTAETLLNFSSMRKQSRSEHARRWQKLLVGPWGHGTRPEPRYGDMDFGSEVRFDARALRLRWFDYHLKGVRNGLDKEAPVRIFVMGANTWRDEQEWPLTRARATRFYLHSKGFANTRSGDGTLSIQAPQTESVDRFRYDPRAPVPTYGGHGCCGAGLTPDGPLDQRSTQQRNDILVYTSPPLEQDMEVTGRPEVQLFFATDVTDTDLFATLSDVHPDGRTILITEGAIRTRFRDSLEKPALLTPNQVYEIRIPLWETSNLFKKGHRVRLHITSSNFPRFNRNLNSGKPPGDEAEADIRIATQTIYHEASRASSLVLPVVP